MRAKEAAEKSVTLSGAVQKIIAAVHPMSPEKAQIVVEGAEDLYREIRIENSFADEQGNQVSLAAGAEVEIVIKTRAKRQSPQGFS